ncbi:MAG: DNA gyrase subunit A [bacterium]
MRYLKPLMDQNFLEYASYVIKDRAIPDILDGLKPVQRRILYSMREMDDGKFIKVANIVGDSMKLHPHGDASIGSALIVMANKEYFIEKQGNFGNLLTGDPASAPRYIEARLTPLAKEVLFNSELTEFSDSYDGRNQEPVVLPSKLPVSLLFGAEGIAVGMSTRILPHNFNEVLDAQIAFLKKESFRLFPDFMNGGLLDTEQYEDGNGKVRVRARIDVIDEKNLDR